MTRDDYIEPDPRDRESEAIEREDAADQAIVDRQRETLDDPGIWLRPGEYTAQRPSFLDTCSAPADLSVPMLMLRNHTAALARIEAATLHPAVAEYAIAEVARMRPVYDALTVWRDAELNDDDADALLATVRDLHDRSRGLGIGQDWRTGGDAA